MTLNLQTRYGTMACLEADSVVSRSLDVYGEWAQLEMDLIASLVRPGETVADVGAFLGTHTLALARMVGTHGYVHSFEPRREIRELLYANVHSNRLEQVEIHPFALGRTTGAIDIAAVETASQGNFGGLSIVEVPTGFDGKTESISIRTLDDMELPCLHFLKIDAEGMEGDVIEGGRRTIARHRPIIFAECNDLKHGASLLEACLEAGNVVFGAVTPAFNPGNFRQAQDNYFGKAAEVSLIAVPHEKMPAAIAGIDPHVLMPIDSLDGLSVLLLHKPQYFEEVILNTAGGRFLRERSEGHFGVPGTPSLIPTLTMHDALVRSAADLSARVETLTRDLDAALLDRENYKAMVTSLSRYRRTSLLRLWESLCGKLGAPFGS